MTETFTIFIDGRQAEAEKGAMLLDVIRGAGVHVPTLCHHPSLEPTGACRLCVVEITHPDWNGWSGLVTSCLYPVEPGLQVFTRSDRVVAARRTLLDMLLARCPDADVVRELARAEGLEASTFPGKADADRCVLCGLCVKACQDLGPGAIAPLGRGSQKSVGPRPDMTGEDCTGCGACAFVCPTGEIRIDRRPGVLTIWNRDFDVQTCTVQTNDCRGCGVCEEVCPLSIPRVVARRTRTFVSSIAAEVCTGCGLCAGACPAGAITQEAGKGGDPVAALPAGSLEGKVPVFACSRSALGKLDPADHPGLVPVELSCVGRVTVEDMLECLARGARGVVVMGRDRETCPFGPGEDQAEERVAVADAIAAMTGLGSGRIRFVLPAYGQDGPAAACGEAASAFAPTPLRAVFGGHADSGNGEDEAAAESPLADGDFGSPLASGMDRILGLVRWLNTREELEPAVPAGIAALFGGGGTGDVLYLGDLPVIDMLLSLLVKERRLGALFEDAAAFLEQQGISARPVTTAREVEAAGAKRVLAFCECCLPGFERGVEIVTLDSLAVNKKGKPRPSGEPAMPEIGAGFRFRITAKERLALAMALQTATLLCTCPGQIAQLMLLLREGAWRTGAAPEPFMAFQDQVRTAAGEAVS